LSPRKSLIFSVPQLFPFLTSSQEGGELPILTTVISKANQYTFERQNNNLGLFSFFSKIKPDFGDCHAALELYALGNCLDSWVCYAEPVLMQPNREHLSLSRADGFELNKEEANSFCIELNDYFKAYNLEFSFIAPNRWICCAKKGFDVSKYAPQLMLGANVLRYSPQDADNLLWRKISNESQMLLHHSTTNQKRILNGKPEFNSLWFWGGGTLPATYQSDFECVLSNSNEILGLAKLGKAKTRRLDSESDINDLVINDSSCVYLDLLQIDEKERLIEDYLKTFIDFLKNEKISELVLIPDFDKKFVLKANDLNKFWRIRKSVSKYL